MPDLFDPLAAAGDLLVEHLENQSELSQLHWQEWESDVDVAQPRGWVNTSAQAALTYADGPMMMAFEVVVEAKPLTPNISAMMAVVQAVINDPKLPEKLNALVEDGSIQFYQRAEDMAIDRVIQGDLRVRRVRFNMAAQWNVVMA